MNWKTIKRILLMIAFLTFSISSVYAEVLPAGSTEYDFIYDWLEHSETLEFSLDDYQLGPYLLKLTRDNLRLFDWLGDLQPKQAVLFGFAGEDFTSSKYSPARGYESFRGGITLQPLDQLFIYSRFTLDEQKAKDPDYTGKKWRGLAGDIEQAFASVQNGSLHVMLGRFASFWGPRESLVLAANVAMDGLAYSWRWGRLTLSYRLAQLDGLNPDEDEVTQFENRYFAGHRLDIHLNRRIRIGFSETAIFGGPGRQIDLHFLNPLIFFHTAQLNSGQNDNTLLGFDFDLKPGYGIRLFGQMLIDDFQIDRNSQGDEEPNEYGFLVGGYVADMLARTDLKATYTRVTNWTFNQNLHRNRYVFDNSPIGAALGNDYDLTSVSVLHWFSPTERGALHFSYLRRGEGSINADWTAPWSVIEGNYREPFPTGTVEKTTRFSLSYTRFILGNFFFDTEAGINRVCNNNHIDGNSRTVPFLRLNVSAFFSSRIKVN